MTTKTSLSALVVTAGVLVASLTAQTDASKDKMGQMKAKMQQKMAAKGDDAKMAGMMGEMMAHHSEITQLVDKLAQSFAAVQAEKDPTALAKKIAEHGALLKELQAKMAEHEKMMAKEAEQAAPAKPAEAAPADPHAGHH